MTTLNLENIELDVAKLRSGDQSEFSRLVELTSARIYQTALRILDQEALAEDVLQDTYVKALQNISKFEERSSILTWLYRIAVNESLMILRKQKRADLEPIFDEQEDDFQLHPQNLRDWSPLPEEALGNQETNRELDKAIQGLPASLKVVFILRDIQEFSIAETAKALNLSEANTKVRLLRARLKLREALSDYFEERIGAR